MPNIPGTVVVAPVVPTSTDDVYPTHHASYGKGGLRTVPSIVDRNLIPAGRLEEGMLVYVESDDSYYKLSGGSWTPFGSGGGGGGGDKNYVHVQSVPASTWVATHNLGKYPSVQLKDASDNVFGADVRHIDINTSVVYLIQADTGSAVFN